MRLIFSAHIYLCDQTVFSFWVIAHFSSFVFVGNRSSVFHATILGIGKVPFPLCTVYTSNQFPHQDSWLFMKVSEFILILPFLEEDLLCFHTYLDYFLTHFLWKIAVLLSVIHYRPFLGIFRVSHYLFWALFLSVWAHRSLRRVSWGFSVILWLFIVSSGYETLQQSCGQVFVSEVSKGHHKRLLYQRSIFFDHIFSLNTRQVFLFWP